MQTLPLINGAILCWAITEVIRYSFYTFKNVSILKHLRYNLFLVLYPLGVSCELLCVLHSCYAVSNMAPEDKYYTLVVPNAANFTFKYEWTIVIFVLVYLDGFPKLFMHMLRQRAKIYPRAEKVEKNKDQ